MHFVVDFIVTINLFFYFEFLNFNNIKANGKTDSILGGPVSELTSLASKLCGNNNPAIVLETDSW